MAPQGSPAIWLHAGLPKCGSTTIQRAMADHDGAYLAQGLCYPRAHREAGGYRSHRPLAFTPAGKIAGMVDDIAAEAAGCRHVLISCEDFAGALPAGNGKPLVEALNARFGAGNVTVLCYVRNVFDFIESAYAQFLAGGLFRIDRGRFFSEGQPDIRTFLRHFEALKGFPLDSLSGYAALIRGSFPANRVMLRSVEPADLAAEGLVADLCGVIGVTRCGAPADRNRRMDPAVVAALNFAQAEFPQAGFWPVRDAFRSFVEAAGFSRQAPFRHPDFCVDEALHRRIADRCDAERARLPELFDTPTDGLLDDRWQPVDPGAQLTGAEKAAIRDFLARAIAGRADGRP
jgi:hypothetical protein